MIIVRRDDNVSGTDMYLAQWNGRTWSAPEAMVSLNGKSNERGPAFSRDGKFLYFSSDREGGQGGYDLYVARRQGDGWSVPEPLGLDVNTASDELGPSLSPDGERLFFSSDRAGKGEDIFVTSKVVEEPDPDGEKPAEESTDPFPQFTDAQPVDYLNSKDDDVQVALTGRGDHVFLASDRARDDKSGFNLYLSRVVDGQTRKWRGFDPKGRTTASIGRLRARSSGIPTIPDGISS
jgi:Tol biopolymer transport system component